ncbi:MAG: tetratricopeptide repeat protein [Chloroflexia bacterium]
MGNEMPFGGWLKQRRKTLGLTQVELARCVGCSARTVIQIELGERRPSRQMAELLARCLHIPSDEVPAFVDYARMTTRSDAPATTQGTAPWLPTQARPHNLPSPPAAFIGREKEVGSACALLGRAEVRLLTMTGAPGIGKTRLSLQVAKTLLESPDIGSADASAGLPFADGIFFVALDSVRDPGLVATTIARALKVREVAGQPLDERLKAALLDKRMLLLIDNFEQVIPGAPVLAQLLAASPGLKLLVTSREALHIYGEYEFRVRPLALPDLQASMPVEQLMRYESVRLFTERATAANLEFAINDENAALIARTCVQLEGLPLAIELAAAHIRDLTPADILARLPGRLELLVGGPQDLPARQQTLRTAIDWSYDLLNEAQQALFRRMSVFAGGFTQEAVEAVCHLDDALGLDFPGSVASLVNKSLLQRESAEEGLRWRMLESIREGAAEWLAHTGEEVAFQRKHAEYYLELAESAEPQLKGAQQVAWLQRLDAEHNNLRTALDWLLRRAEVEQALRLSSALWRFWLIRGYIAEGRGWLAKALALPDRTPGAAQTSALADALNGAGNLAYTAGDYASALALHEENLGARRELGDKQGMAGAFNNLAVVWRDRGDYERASEYFQASLDLKREVGDRAGIASSLNNLGIVKQRQSDYDAAYACYAESLRIWREAGDQYGIATALSNLGVVQSYRGEYAEAVSLQEESLSIRRALGDKSGIAISLTNIASIALAQGDLEAALKLHEENLAIRRERGEKPGIANSLYGLGQVLRRRGDFKQARALLRESLTISVELGNKQGIAECFVELAGVATSEAQTKRHNSRLYKALLEQAARLSGAAEALFEATGFQLQPVGLDEYHRSEAIGRDLLGLATWEALRAEGHALTLEQAVACAFGS